MTKYLIILVILAIAVYGLIEALPLIEGPSISLTSPRDNTPFPGGVVIIKGNAARAAELTLDGAQILHEKNGDFATVITLPRGGSELTLIATDLFGRSATAKRTIFVP